MYSIRHDTEVPLLAGLCFVYQKKRINYRESIGKS